MVCTRFSSRSHELRLGKFVSFEVILNDGSSSTCDGKSTLSKSQSSVLDKNPNGNFSEFAKIKQGMQNQGTSSLSTISFAYSDLPIPLQEACDQS